MEIAELPVLAGWLGICPMPGRSGDYAGDMAALRDWGAELVLTLAGTEELARHGAQDLPRDLVHAGIAWRHFPILDYGLPEPRLRRAWPELAAEVLGWLERGGRVLVHCKGGCGRSGTIALRLMVEAGEPAEEALARLRAVRPCAVETEAQMDWASGGG